MYPRGSTSPKVWVSSYPVRHDWDGVDVDVPILAVKGDVDEEGHSLLI